MAIRNFLELTIQRLCPKENWPIFMLCRKITKGGLGRFFRGKKTRKTALECKISGVVWVLNLFTHKMADDESRTDGLARMTQPTNFWVGEKETSANVLRRVTQTELGKNGHGWSK